jgi:multidrug efflux pump subunit AcrA (membrane-fusion protein)
MSGASGKGGTVSVATAEAQVLAAQQALDKANRNLAAATMTAPISGVVAQLPFAAGDSVTTASTVIVIGTGPASVTLSVPVARIPLVKTGQSATLAQNSLTIGATVTSVSLLPTSGTTYSVTVTSTASGDQLLEGAPATATITTATLTDATLVPVSAVTLDANGTTGTVKIVENDQISSQTVTIAAIGDTAVAVTDGVEPGATVVLADTTTALPTSTNGMGGMGRVMTSSGRSGNFSSTPR